MRPDVWAQAFGRDDFHTTLQEILQEPGQVYEIIEVLLVGFLLIVKSLPLCWRRMCCVKGFLVSLLLIIKGLLVILLSVVEVLLLLLYVFVAIFLVGRTAG